MFMINIPRRKIYETMLEFEEYLLELQILIRNEENFQKFQEKYNQSYLKIQEKYNKINSLLILFFENKKYENQEQFESDLKYYENNHKETINYFKNNKTLNQEQKKIIEILEHKFKTIEKIQNINQGQELFLDLDKYNSNIPKILEIRRDEMK